MLIEGKFEEWGSEGERKLLLGEVEWRWLIKWELGNVREKEFC